jgi:hypothetical protein
MKQFLLISAFLLTAHISKAEIKWPVLCNEPVWAEQKCTDFVNEVKKDPYNYLRATASSVSVAVALIKSKLLNGNKGSESMWSLVENSNQFGGFISALENDTRTVTLLIPPSIVPEQAPIFSGCVYLREYVQPVSEDVCQEFNAPLAKYFYLQIRNYREICRDEFPMDCQNLK